MTWESWRTADLLLPFKRSKRFRSFALKLHHTLENYKRDLVRTVLTSLPVTERQVYTYVFSATSSCATLTRLQNDS